MNFLILIYLCATPYFLSNFISVINLLLDELDEKNNLVSLTI